MEGIFAKPGPDVAASAAAIPQAGDELSIKEALRIIIAAVTECVRLLRRLSDRDPVRQPLAIPLAAYRLRRSRDDIFPDLFADASWDILLYLYECHRVGRAVAVTAACSAAVVPATTALRHIGCLVKAGLVVRTQSAEDSRVHYLKLSGDGAVRMNRWIADAVKIIEFPDRKPI